MDEMGQFFKLNVCYETSEELFPDCVLIVCEVFEGYFF
jgi:hypothetical protein